MEFDYVVLKVRPKKDGLHDSGYRFLRLEGVKDGRRTELNQWSDHVVFHGPVNIDVTENGELRIMAWFGRGHGPDFASRGQWVNRDAERGSFFSSADMYANDAKAAAYAVESLNRIHFETLAEFEKE